MKAASLLDSPEWQRQKWLRKVIKRKRKHGFVAELDGNCGRWEEIRKKKRLNIDIAREREV